MQKVTFVAQLPCLSKSVFTSLCPRGNAGQASGITPDPSSSAARGWKGVKFHSLSDPRGPFSIRTWECRNSSCFNSTIIHALPVVRGPVKDLKLASFILGWALFRIARAQFSGPLSDGERSEGGSKEVWALDKPWIGLVYRAPRSMTESAPPLNNF